eukprot:TRINITY_DN115_c0_g1_i3.p1 TRINITY_DN115_c0_g1~~TRINITY_DN115_c0_g1_i3.p1  ORF type:complete len:293 (+),score=53.70 TRINITY_DN115_c0_g1_i3:189-1067(+)
MNLQKKTLSDVYSKLTENGDGFWDIKKRNLMNFSKINFNLYVHNLALNKENSASKEPQEKQETEEEEENINGNEGEKSDVSYLEEEEEEEEVVIDLDGYVDNQVVYNSAFGNPLRLIKLLSVTSCFATTILTPIFASLRSNIIEGIGAYAIAGTVMTTGLITTGLLYYVSSPFVTKIKYRYNDKENSDKKNSGSTDLEMKNDFVETVNDHQAPPSPQLEITTFSFFAKPITSVHNFEDIRPYDSNVPFINFGVVDPVTNEVTHKYYLLETQFIADNSESLYEALSQNEPING